MSIKTEVGAILSANINHAEAESAFYAGIGEYGMSDKIDRVVEGLRVARQAYLDTFQPAPTVQEIPLPEPVYNDFMVELEELGKFILGEFPGSFAGYEPKEEPLEDWEFDLLYSTLTQKMHAAPIGTKIVPKAGHFGVSSYTKVDDDRWSRELYDGTFSNWPFSVENFSDEEDYFEVVLP